MLKDKLSGDVVKKTLAEHKIEISESNIMYDELASTLLSNMLNIDEAENIDSILSLSLEEKSTVNFTLNNILSKKDILEKDILDKFERNKKITLKIKYLKDKLNSSVPKELLNSYLESMNKLSTQILEVENALAVSKSNLNQKVEELHVSEYHLTRARNEYTSLLQSNNVLDMSQNLVEYLNELLNNLTKDKICLIQDEFVNIFSKIIRKDNYIDSIVIDESFNSTLYINKDYTSTELINIIKNLGLNGISSKYGHKFIEDLNKHYDVNNIKDLENKIVKDLSYTHFSLSTKVNVNDFSNGEKQIYILCLIWAIIKTSGVEIPFIIDTPYARIDDTHRNSLTNTYLPNISKQVIILSTNQEIDSDLYKVLSPYICDEYLLLYNTEARKTEVINGYFEV